MDTANAGAGYGCGDVIGLLGSGGHSHGDLDIRLNLPFIGLFLWYFQF
jgi:hypothetical protein